MLMSRRLDVRVVDRFFPNDIFRIEFGEDGFVDIGVSKNNVLLLKVKGSGETNVVASRHYLKEEDARGIWEELVKLFDES